MRIGILGGTFDPIHYGHLAVADLVCSRLSLSRVLLVPAAQQPLKQRPSLATAAQRLAMVELACQDYPRLQPCRLELDRPPPSYTVDTLSTLARQFPAPAELFLIIGADAANDLARWRAVPRIAELAHLVVVTRPAVAFDPADATRLYPQLRGRLISLPGPDLAISSTALRARLAAGDSLRYLLPESVRRYMVAQHLARPETGE